MKLTKEQIQKIEDYLTNKDVEYIDLHLEVLDHISTDIENIMTENKVDFNNAFEDVKLKWDKTFTYKWTFWLGISNGGSKLFIDHCLEIYKPLSLKIIISILIFTSSFYWFIKSYNIELITYKSIIHKASIAFSVIFALIIYYWIFSIKRTKLKSTFSYLFTKHIAPTLFSVFIFLVLDEFNNQQEFKFIKVLMFSSFVAILWMGNIFYKNHLKAVLNFKKYQLK